MRPGVPRRPARRRRCAPSFDRRPPFPPTQAINVDVNHTVYEVQEEFAIGLGEVVRTRAAEKARTRPPPPVPLAAAGPGPAAAACTSPPPLPRCKRQRRVAMMAPFHDPTSRVAGEASPPITPPALHPHPLIDPAGTPAVRYRTAGGGGH